MGNWPQHKMVSDCCENTPIGSLIREEEKEMKKDNQYKLNKAMASTLA